MKSASDTSTSGPVQTRDPSPQPPAPTGDPFIDEIRAAKYELSARFDHDLERLGNHLREIQEDIARRDPQRIVRQAGRKP